MASSEGRQAERGRKKKKKERNERSAAIYSWAARARKARQFYGQLGDASGLTDHRAVGLDLAPSLAHISRTHTQNRPHNTHNDMQTGCKHIAGET